MNSSDWMPRTRQKKIDRAQTWINVLTEDVRGNDGKNQKKYVLWKMSAGEFDKLVKLCDAAREVLELAKGKETRTEVVNRKVEDTLNELEAYMRELKRMYFHVPPLANADMVSLGFTVHDTARTQLGNPTATVAVRTALGGGYNQLDVFIETVSGDLNERDNQGYFYICWLVVPAGSPAPTSPKQLTTDHINTKRHKERVTFEYGSSGSDVYFCARIEEGDRKGEWGPIVRARIP